MHPADHLLEADDSRLPGCTVVVVKRHYWLGRLLNLKPYSATYRVAPSGRAQLIGTSHQSTVCTRGETRRLRSMLHHHTKGSTP